MASLSTPENNVAGGVQGASVADHQVNKAEDESKTGPTDNTEAGEERTFTIFRKLPPRTAP